MKKNLLVASAFALCISLGASLSSCGDNTQKDTVKNTEAAAPGVEQKTLPNFRYVDVDSILSKYNLAKDYNEEMMRMQNNMESEVKRHQNAIQSLGATIQKKLQNNGYFSEQSYKSDEEKFNNMQANAQRSVASLQSNFENAALAAQKAVSDSIIAFVKEYNAKKGYDAILRKDGGLYFNPELDITDEIVEGLNARYNKVSK